MTEFRKFGDDSPLNLFERLSTRRSYNKNKIPENKIIEWMDTLTPTELTEQIEKTINSKNNFINAVETLSFDVANYIYNFNKIYATPSTFWTIMIFSYNNKIEEKNPELFMKAFNFFCKILDDYDVDKIYRGSLLNISIRFKTILFTKKLVEKGLSLKHYNWGFSPLLELVKNTINSKFNKEMFDYILTNGSSVDEITKHDDIEPRKRVGANTYHGFPINKTPGLSTAESIHKNVLEIITMSYNTLIKYNVLGEIPDHPIYDLIKYFNIKIEKNEKECCVCWTKGDMQLEKLHCSHEICINCAIEIQTNDKIICPLCRTINDYSHNPYLVTLLVSDIGEIKVRKETKMKELINICQNKRGYKYIVLSSELKTILPTNKTLKEMGIKNNSSIHCFVRMPHQLDPEEYEEWCLSGKSLVIG